jgi:hypothetical protein
METRPTLPRAWDRVAAEWKSRFPSMTEGMRRWLLPAGGRRAEDSADGRSIPMWGGCRAALGAPGGLPGLPGAGLGERWAAAPSGRKGEAGVPGVAARGLRAGCKGGAAAAAEALDL